MKYEVVQEGFGADDNGQIVQKHAVILDTDSDVVAHTVAMAAPHRFVREVVDEVVEVADEASEEKK